jgi:hypothetical protein
MAGDEHSVGWKADLTSQEAGKLMPESSPMSAMVARLCSGHVGGLFVLLLAQNRTTKRVSQSQKTSLPGRLAVINLVVFFGVREEFAIIVTIRSDGS